MHLSLRIALVSSAATCVVMAACGGNVVVDGQPSASSASSAGGATTVVSVTATGASVSDTSTVTGFGTTTISSTTGFGAAPTSSSISTVTATSSSVTTTTTGGTGGTTGACADPADNDIFDTQVIWPAISKCGQQNLMNQTADQACLIASTGLSSGCTACIAKDLVACALMDCLNECASNPNGLSCSGCRQMNCGVGFEACSGAIQPGTALCNTLYGSGPKLSGWPSATIIAEFLTPGAHKAYESLTQCGCGATSVAGCEKFCDGNLTGTADWCNDAPASGPCDACLQTTCAAQIMTCQAN